MSYSTRPCKRPTRGFYAFGPTLFWRPVTCSTRPWPTGGFFLAFSPGCASRFSDHFLACRERLEPTCGFFCGFGPVCAGKCSKPFLASLPPGAAPNPAEIPRRDKFPNLFLRRATSLSNVAWSLSSSDTES
jgi:hypothetical protein